MPGRGNLPAQEVEAGQVVWVDFSGVGIVSVPPLGCRGWRGSWRRRTCRSRNGRRTGNLRFGPVRPGSRRSRRTYQNSVSGDLISFLLQGRRKPRTFSSMSPACACRLFSVVRSKWRSFFPDQPPDGGQQGVLFMGPYRPSCTRCLSAAPLGWNSGCAKLPAAGAMSEKKKG